MFGVLLGKPRQDRCCYCGLHALQQHFCQVRAPRSLHIVSGNPLCPSFLGLSLPWSSQVLGMGWRSPQNEVYSSEAGGCAYWGAGEGKVPPSTGSTGGSSLGRQAHLWTPHPTTILGPLFLGKRPSVFPSELVRESERNAGSNLGLAEPSRSDLILVGLNKDFGV